MIQLCTIKGTGKSSGGHVGKVFSLEKVINGETAELCHM